MKRIKKIKKSHSKIFLVSALVLIAVVGLYSVILYPLTGTKAAGDLATATAVPQGLANGVTGAENATWRFILDNSGGTLLTAYNPPGVLTQDMVKITFPNVQQGNPWIFNPDSLTITADPGATGLIFQGVFTAEPATFTFGDVEYLDTGEEPPITHYYYSGGGYNGLQAGKVPEGPPTILSNEIVDGVNDFNLALLTIQMLVGGNPEGDPFSIAIFARNDNYPDAATLEADIESWDFGPGVTLDVTTDLWVPSAMVANGPNAAYSWDGDTAGLTYNTVPVLAFDAQKILDNSQPDGPSDIIKIPIADGQDALGEFTLTISGLNVPTAPLANLENLEFTLETCRLADPTQPDSECTPLENGTSLVTLDRLGEMIPYNADFDFYPGNYGTGENTTYTLSFTSPSGLDDTNKIVWEFPAGFIITAADVSGLTDINGAGAGAPSVADDPDAGAGGGIYVNTANGRNQIELTVTGTVNADDVVTVTVNDIYNPNMKGSYRGFGLYTALANGGIIDGLPTNAGMEPGRNGPPILESLQIGGTNTITGTVMKDEGAGPVALEADEAAQIMIGLGCPDKQFFVGQKYLQPDGTFTYNNLLDCNYKMGTEPADKESNPTFFMDFLQPAMLDIPAQGGQSFNITPIFIVPDAYISGTVTSDDSVGGSEEVFINAFNNTHMSWSPVFQEDPIANPAAAPGLTAEGVGYFAMPVKSGYTWSVNVMVNNQTETLVDPITNDEYWAPVINPVVVATAGETYDIGAQAFVKADKTLNIFLRNSNDNQIMNSACVSVRRPNPLGFMGGFAKCSSQDIEGVQGYPFKVPSGALLVDIGQWGLAKPVQKQITVKANDTTVDKTFYLEMPTSYISVTVEDSDGEPISQTPLFAHGSNGFGQAVTDSNGEATIYVREGVYRVEGHVPNLGPLDYQDGIEVAEGTNPAVTFTVDVSELNLISGRVYIDANGNDSYDVGEEVAGAQIGCHGPNGGNGTVTLSDGTYQMRVKAGTYYVGGWSNQTGGLPEQEVDVSEGNMGNIDFSVSLPGSLQITVEGAAGMEFFAGAFDPTTHKGNGTNVWTTTGGNLVTTLPLPEGTYLVHVGSPAFGEITDLGGDTQTITGNSTTEVTYTIPDFNTLSGQVTDGTDPVANVEVWATNKNGPGFFRTLTDASGNYSMKLASGDDYDYDVGANMPGYLSSISSIEGFNGDVGNYDLVITEATGSITGTVVNGEGEPLNQGWAWADKVGENAWVGAPVEANGTFELTVDDGTWVVHADSPCHQPDFEGTEAQDGDDLTIELTANEGCEPPTPKMNPITPASGGTVYNDEDGDGNNDVEVVIPANALGTGSDNVTFSVTPNDNPVDTLSASALKAEDFDATSSDGDSITTLNNNIDITLDYGDLDLPDDFDESTLQLAYFDNASNSWVPIASSVNPDDNSITGQANHLTTFGIITTVPAAPQNLAASATGTTVSLTWSAPSGATSYTVYRSTESGCGFSAIGTSDEAAYTNNSGLSGNTTYYYKVTASNAVGESAFSSEVEVTTGSAGRRPSGDGGGGSGAVITTAPKQTASGSNIVTAAQGGSATATTADGGSLQVTMPAGAVTGQTTLNVVPTTPASASAATPQSGYFAIGNYYFNISSTSNTDSFFKPVTLTFTYEDAMITGMNEDSLKIHWYNPTTKAWEALECTVDKVNNTVTTTVNHFSLYAIMGAKAPTETGEPATGVKAILYRSPSVSTVFVIDETKKTKSPIFNETVFLLNGYSWAEVKTVSEATLAQYTLGKMLMYPEGSVVKFITSPKVFKVGANYVLNWITNETVFKGLGYAFNQVKDLTDSFWSLFNEGNDIK